MSPSMLPAVLGASPGGGRAVSGLGPGSHGSHFILYILS